MSIKLIGLSGKAGSGKDTVGIRALRPLGYQQYSLAWPLKNEAVGGFFKPETGLMDRLVLPTYEEVHVTKPDPIRKWMQVRGTEQGWQLYGENYWIRIAEAWMRTMQDAYGFDKFYVPDIRFPHEARWILSRGGLLIRLEGRGGLTGPGSEHLSETALDDWNFAYRIDNSGLLEDTVEAVQQLARRR